MNRGNKRIFFLVRMQSQDISLCVSRSLFCYAGWIRWPNGATYWLHFDTWIDHAAGSTALIHRVLLKKEVSLLLAYNIIILWGGNNNWTHSITYPPFLLLPA